MSPAAEPVPAEPVGITYILPAHNSGPIIERTVDRIAERLAGTPAEVIVVENGSSDDTWDRCSAIAAAWSVPTLAFRAIQSPKGMGNALRAGVLASRGSYLVLSADDLPFGFDDLDGFEELAQRESGRAAFLIGSKAHPNSVVDRGRQRSVMTGAFSQLCRIVLGMRTRDPQGTLIVRGELARELVVHTRESGFLFSTELVHLAERSRVRPVELPVRLAADHARHASRVRARDVVAMAVGLVRLRLRHRRTATRTAG